MVAKKASIGILLLAAACSAARIKDVARLDGLTETQLIGYGLVIGLKGTGDGPRTQFTTQSIVNMLRNTGIEVPRERIQVRNVAAVMITTKLGPYLKKGARLDVTVSSVGDAKSLEGGTLLLSPLQSPDGEIYALAQGPMSIGGMNRESQQGKSSFQKNHALVGELPGGAIVQKEIPVTALAAEDLNLSLSSADFSSAVAMAKAVNAKFGSEIAKALDPVSVRIGIPAEYKAKPMEFMAEVENLDFQISMTARVVLNEKTGTVIAGGNVSISQVAVSHGSITIEIKQNQKTEIQNVVPPLGGAVQQVSRSESEDMKVAEEKADMKVIPSTSNVADLAKSLNALGVTPRDIIAIFQAIKRAGALNAELIVM